jgi:RNA polymerase sigma-70 factor, ECF subfamily
VELEQLHGAHATAVRAYALRRTDPATADDVCAEVWAIAWRRLESIPDDALPWLFGVARRVLANQRRGERRLAALRGRLLESGFGWAGSVPPPAIPSDRRLADALSSLRPADREALLLVAWEGLEPVRAAAALGVSPATFSVRLHRARKRLATELDRAAVPRATQEVTP